MGSTLKGRNLLLKEQILSVKSWPIDTRCSKRSKFFPLRAGPIDKGDLQQNGRVASVKTLSVFGLGLACQGQMP